jgi:hypothetical protein
VGILRDHRFWIGVAAGYLFLVVFPQFNVRAAGVKASIGKA